MNSKDIRCRHRWLILQPVSNRAYRSFYLRQIPVIAAIAGFLGLFWAVILNQIGWTDFPPDPETVLIIAGGSLIFFLGNAMSLMRREFVISTGYIDLPTLLWKKRIHIDLQREPRPHFEVHSFHGVALTLGIQMEGEGRQVLPLFVSRRESARLGASLQSISDSGLASVTFTQIQKPGGVGGVVVGAVLVPTMILGVGVAVLAGFSWSGGLGYIMAGNLAVLLLFICYFAAIVTFQRNVRRLADSR